MGLLSPVEHLVLDRRVVRLKRQQRLAAVVVEAAHQRELGAILLEHQRRTVGPLVGALQRLADVGKRDRAVDVDQFALLAQNVEELAKILIRHL